MIHDPIATVRLDDRRIDRGNLALSIAGGDVDCYHGGAILVSHGTSEKESGHKSTRSSGNLSDTQLVIAQRPAKSVIRFNLEVKIQCQEFS